MLIEELGQECDHDILAWIGIFTLLTYISTNSSRISPWYCKLMIAWIWALYHNLHTPTPEGKEKGPLGHWWETGWRESFIHWRGFKKMTAFSRSQRTTQVVVEDFERWIHHFKEMYIQESWMTLMIFITSYDLLSLYYQAVGMLRRDLVNENWIHQ